MPAMKAMRRRGMKRAKSAGGKRGRSAGGDDEDTGFGGAPEKKLRRGKSVEQTYQKKTQVEHILIRPDTYVGSVEKQDDTLWVWNEKKGEMEFKGISYVPALYKIFDEILVNAADNLQRDPKMNTIKVDIDKNRGRIKVWNNGKGLPIQIHKKYKVFVPELVFGHLLTSDNYDDSEKKVTGGRNGFGAKLTNIYSKRFIIETGGSGKKYKQEWNSNMSKKGKPDIKKASGEAFTCVEFWPDLSRFGMKELEADTVALMMRRVYDIAGTSGERCKVFLNGKKLPVKNFEDYCSYYHSGQGHAYAQIGKRWQVLVARSDGDGFQQCCFVNHISTPKGGTHVNYVLDQLVDGIISKASKQHKGSEVKRVHVKSHLSLFVNCLIENPAFSSQTKEQMTLKTSMFGSSCNIQKSFLDEICANTGIVDAVVAEAQAKMTATMDRDISSSNFRGKRVLGVPKLEDANDAGSKFSKDCTLILTEGDSAKALAIAGLSVIGRDKYGVFPLRGKLLNVRDVQQKQVAENKEIMNVLKILGLSFGNKTGGDLRYGTVMIMADQDHDGSHIKGLLINFLHYWWPDLLKQNKGFVKEFVTPIVKVTKIGGTEVKPFFTQTEYEAWKKKTGGKGYKVKYYKGLGTSTSQEAREYFKDIQNHVLNFKWNSPADGKLIDMAFNKGRADDRKKWMNKYQEGQHVDHSKNNISYQDFVNKELVQFARYDLMRSVPSVMDGLKPTQRKVLFGCFKRNLRSDVKVAQLVGYVAEHSAYHHGESSLATTIINMAQDFVGSNNLNLLVPSGQFGTRLQGGKDAASPRYIYTRLAPITRLIFSPLDDAVLEYQEEEGQRIEPYWYAPIIPLVLVNGADGIGTGWSTSIPNYDPREIIANMRAYIKKKKMKIMRPWYRGFTGTIKPSGEKGKLDCIGVWNEQGRVLQITELPLRRWTQDYKDFLQTMLPGSDKKTKIKLTDVREYHTEHRVNFMLRVDNTSTLKAAKEEGGIDVAFRLRGSISETNMVLFDHEGKITKYKNVIEIMKEFAKVRLKIYDVRKKYLVDKLTLEKELLANRARFIGMIIAKKLHINNRKKADVVKDLTRLKFRKFGDTTAPRTGFEYLLIMQIASLTLERKLELEALFKAKAEELVKLKKTTIQQMWLNDLDALEEAVHALYDADARDLAETSPGGKGKKRASTGDDEDGDNWADEAQDAMKRPASALGSGKLWAGAKRRGGGGGRGYGKVRGKGGRGRGKKGAADDEEESEGGDDGDDETKPAADPMDNIFGDTTRWTSGALKAPAGIVFGKKRRSS
eukprot:TRINITY_DN54374_c0_g1_i1.p1 TRINITY_DN54374_c0_g1~~TRINITY_DN54374_c0_g1_i1.p1  ORF type:complete len:1314 (-),score=374.03 TRINITY_DN54374_c0_g1_i1:105-3977(-)